MQKDGLVQREHFSTNGVGEMISLHRYWYFTDLGRRVFKADHSPCGLNYYDENDKVLRVTL
jgi:hypothetical protein